ncbi:hypothetical protein ACFY9S_05085 [Streptomyces sp. NPDC012474]|uniref:hypothetical protein n=1 Tax=Streptomyces sp. NPDC012474 TaxID=3364836 RepID=UPI0036ED2DA2
MHRVAVAGQPPGVRSGTTADTEHAGRCRRGITPAARGAGGITRRVIGTIDRNAARLGVGAMVRDAYGYWSLFGVLRPPWPEIARAIEEEMRL